jgi:hypothetical protein
VGLENLANTKKAKYIYLDSPPTISRLRMHSAIPSLSVYFWGLVLSWKPRQITDHVIKMEFL